MARVDDAPGALAHANLANLFQQSGEIQIVVLDL
jgi:hypothetical protein